MDDDTKLLLVILGVVGAMAIFWTIIFLPIGFAHNEQYDCIGEWVTLNSIDDKDGYIINFYENGTGSIKTKLSSNTFTWEVIDLNIKATVYLSDMSTTKITFECYGEKLYLNDIILYKRIFT